MGLVSCPDCGQRVSDRAKACPNCGSPISDFRDDLIQSEKDRIAEEAQKAKEQTAETVRLASERMESEREVREKEKEEKTRQENRLEELRKVRYKGHLVLPILAIAIVFAQIVAWIILIAGIIMGLIGIVDARNLPDPPFVATISIAGIVFGIVMLRSLRHTFLWKRGNAILHLLCAVTLAVLVSKITPVLGFPIVVNSVLILLGLNMKTQGYKIWTIMDWKGIKEDLQKETRQKQEANLDSSFSYSGYIASQAYSFTCKSCGKQIYHSIILKTGDEVFCKQCGSSETVPNDSKIAPLAEYKKYLSMPTKGK